MKCRSAGDCPIIHIKFPGSPALPPHGMKVMSEARKMMTSSQLCHPPGAVTDFPGTGLTTKRCSRPIGNRIPNGRESCSQGLGILFPASCAFPYPCGLSDRSGFVLGTVQIYPDSTKTSFYIKSRCVLPDCYQTFSHW